MMDKDSSKILLNGAFYFPKLPDGSVDKSKAICTLCKAELKYHRSTSSLSYHLRAKHIINVTKVDASSLRQSSILESATRRPADKTKSQKITTALAKWVATNCRPVSIVEDSGLKEVLRIACSDPSYTLPSRGTVVSRIQSLYDTEKAAKLELLQSANAVSLTGDHWTSVSNHNYLEVTAHYIDSGWTLHSFALTVRHTEERHNAETCAEHFSEVAEAWGIANKVTTIGTDSARNMLAAARLLPYEHMPCVAHSLQRSIAMSIRESGFENVLAKCRKLVGHFKHSPANAAELQCQQRQRGQDPEPLIQDVPTRWNSTLSMITRLEKNKDALRAILDLHQQRSTPAFLTNAEFEKIKKLETVLEPCRYVTELVGGEQYISCSVVLPALCHLFRVMEVSDDDPGDLCRFKEAFTADLSKWKESMNIQWLKVATAVDPRFKDLKCLPRSERDEVWRLIKELNAQQHNNEATDPEPPKKKMSLLVASDSEDEEETAADNSVDRYRAEPTISVEDCPLKWWSAHAGAYPNLALLAQKYLATPATTVPCERLFSLSGHIVQNKRASLSSENVTNLVCLSDWLK
ncbi:E3 SUMO-protein ligase ZBED1-like [Sander vitreus]